MGPRTQETDRSWWSRNWGWCVGCGCLLPLAAMVIVAGGLFVGTKNLIGNNEAIQQAMDRVRADERAVESLGQPIEISVWREGADLNFRFGTDDDATLETTLGLRGPRGEGHVELEARRSAGSET